MSKRPWSCLKRQDPGVAELTVAGLDAGTRVSADTGSYPPVENDQYRYLEFVVALVDLIVGDVEMACE